MQEIKEILEFIKEHKKNVLEIQRQSGISSNRIYKWLKGDGMPKAEDSEKLRKWAQVNLAKERSWEKAAHEDLGYDPKTTTPQLGIPVEEYVSILKKYNDQMTGVIEKNLTSIQSNLALSQQLLLALQTSQAAQHSVILESLERIEKSKTGVLAKEADRRQVELNAALMRKGIHDDNGG